MSEDDLEECFAVRSLSNCSLLEEGRRNHAPRQSLPPIGNSPRRKSSSRARKIGSTKQGAAHIEDDKWESPDNGAPSSWKIVDMSPTSLASKANNGGAAGKGMGLSSQEGTPVARDSGHGEEAGSEEAVGVVGKNPLGGVAVGGEGFVVCGDGGSATKKANAGGQEKERDSARRLFIGWMQKRQRECVTIISLGCVSVTFAQTAIAGASSTLGVAVVLIPVTVHLLLVRDVWMKWGKRQSKVSSRLRLADEGRADNNHQPVTAGGETESSPTNTNALTPVESSSNTDNKNTTNNNIRAVREGRDGGGDGPSNGDSVVSGRRGTGGNAHGGGHHHITTYSNGRVSVHRSGSSDSLSSSKSSARGRQRSECSFEDSWSTSERPAGVPEDNLLSLLETPFQKSVRLLNSASDSVEDPTVRRQLKRVARLLSEPDALHIVKERSIRRVATDSGTRSYIENVLQTPVKGSSADRNWKKLRTGMFVVRALAKEAATGEAVAATGESIETGTSSNQTDLDELLDDIANGIAGAGAPVEKPKWSSNAGPDIKWDEEDFVTFDQVNRSLIQNQQLVAKTMSRGDLRKDLERLSVRELRDLVRDDKPEKIMEHPPGQEPSETQGEDTLLQDMKMKLVPRLPNLDEERMEEVAALMAEGRFLQWDMNVFELEEKSDGHSLWFTAMATFTHFNLIGAFGMNLDRLSQMFLCVEASYCYDPEAPNSYHTHVHAADVTLTVAHFLSVDVISSTVRSNHGVALLMAAIMHDYRHPGVNNGYLVRDLDPLAVTYNDASVLENFHAAEGFKMMLHQKFDVFKGWKAEDVKFFRHAYVKCILATDLSLSLEYISKFQSLNSNMLRKSASGVSAGSPKEGSPKGSGSGNGGGGGKGKTGAGAGERFQKQLLLLQMVLKVADVAHPSKPWDIHRKWSHLVTEEFFRQGDKEREQGLPMSPLCDRRDENLPKSQCDFIDFIVRPCVSIFSTYCQVTTWNDQLNSNFKAWKTLLEEQNASGEASSPSGRQRSPQ